MLKLEKQDLLEHFEAQRRIAKVSGKKKQVASLSILSFDDAGIGGREFGPCAWTRGDAKEGKAWEKIKLARVNDNTSTYSAFFRLALNSPSSASSSLTAPKRLVAPDESGGELRTVALMDHHNKG